MRSLPALLCVVLQAAIANVAAVAPADRLVGGVPIPGDVAVSPAADPSRPGRDFLGAWVGSWGGSLRHVLVVESAEPNGAVHVLYAVGDAPGQGVKAASMRREGVVSGRELVLSGAPYTATYRLDPDGTLEGLYVSGTIRSYARLRRVALDELRADASLPWGQPERVFLDGPVEGAQPQPLEVALFRPQGPGPHPLAVVNHGSTGLGRDPRSFGRTWWSFGLADTLVRHGWIVAFPQRRGRGRSGGLYDEGFAEDRARGYTCEADISLRGAERALVDIEAAVTALRRRDDVAPGAVLMAGQSRGGILALAYAGRHPEDVSGVIDFVGGWLGAACGSATQVNQALFRVGAGYKKPTLWLYGEDDLFYPIAHSRQNFEAFRGAAGEGTFMTWTVPGQRAGHALISHRELWRDAVDRYLAGAAATGP